jgi:hypothetical protein
MILEPNDVAAIRLAEARGRFASEPELARSGLRPAEFAERLARVQSGGVIKAWKTTLAVPPLLGGEWVLGVVLAGAPRSLGPANALAAKLPFVTEIVLNDCLPEGAGPALAVLFYSRDFASEAQFIGNTAGLGYHEVHKLAGYEFPMRLPMSDDEKALLRLLAEQPHLDAAGIGSALGRDGRWVGAKLDRLLWSEANPSGVVRVQPELDWSRADNFGHCHFLLETGHRPEALAKMVEETGYRLVFGGKRFRDRYVQVEGDAWGIARMMDAAAALEALDGVRVAGVLTNREVIVNTKWVGSLLG